MDRYIFRKDVTEENVPIIEIDYDSNTNIFTYGKYICVLAENTLNEYSASGKKEKDGKTIKEECALWKQRADKKGRMAAVSGVGRRGSHACVYCSFFSRYSFIASFTMSFSDVYFLMARNVIRV